jgi:hypothetical protein
LRQTRRDEAPARRTLGAQIDRLDRGKVPTAEALSKMHPRIAAAPCIDLRLDRRRRRHEHDRNVGLPRTHHRHVARMIARAVLLLVGGVVLLVDDNEPEVGIGQKQGGARPDDHADVSPRHGAPRARAQAL